MIIRYEWTVEVIRDYGDGVEDIIESDFFDTFAKAKQNSLINCNPVHEYVQIGLVRQVFDSVDTLLSTSWAYITDGKLPEYLTDSSNRQIRKIPIRFHKEIAA